MEIVNNSATAIYNCILIIVPFWILSTIKELSSPSWERDNSKNCCFLSQLRSWHTYTSHFLQDISEKPKPNTRRKQQHRMMSCYDFQIKIYWCKWFLSFCFDCRSKVGVTTSSGISMWHPSRRCDHGQEMSTCPIGNCKWGLLTTFPQCDFWLEFPGILSQNLICYHWLSVTGNSKIIHCGILINIPLWFSQLNMSDLSKMPRKFPSVSI